jgi:hypothetical protein
MSYRPIRIADIAIDRRVVSFLRAIFPFWGVLVLVMRRRNERKTTGQAERLGEQVAQIVVEAKEGARTLRLLTLWLLMLTIVNVGLVAYSVFK